MQVKGEEEDRRRMIMQMKEENEGKCMQKNLRFECSRKKGEVRRRNFQVVER